MWVLSNKTCKDEVFLGISNIHICSESNFLAICVCICCVTLKIKWNYLNFKLYIKLRGNFANIIFFNCFQHFAFFFVFNLKKEIFLNTLLERNFRKKFWTLICWAKRFSIESMRKLLLHPCIDRALEGAHKPPGTSLYLKSWIIPWHKPWTKYFF